MMQPATGSVPGPDGYYPAMRKPPGGTSQQSRGHETRGAPGSLVLLVLPLCMALLGGCARETTAPNPRNRPAETLQWSPPMSLFSGGGARLVHDGAGRLYAIGRVTGSSNLHVRRSTDHGASWSAPINTGIARSLILYRSVAAVGTTLHILTSAGDNANLIYSRSDDGGLTWPVQHDLSGDVEVRRPHRASIAVAGNYVHIANSRQFNAPNRTVTYWRSTDGGTRFSAPVTIYSEADGGGVNPDLAAGVGGIVHLVLESWDGGNPFPAPYNPVTGAGGIRSIYFRSTNNGTTWPAPQQAVVLGNPILRPRLSAAAGVVTVITETQDGVPGTQELWESHSTNDGASWKAIGRITSTPNLDISHPLVANGSGAQVHIGAFDETNRRLLTVHSGDNGVTWKGPVVAATLAANGIDTPLSMVASGGYLHLLAAAAFTESAAGYMRMRVDGQ